MGAYLGVDIGGTSVKWALVDDAFNMIDRGDTPTDFSTSDCRHCERTRRLVRGRGRKRTWTHL